MVLQNGVIAFLILNPFYLVQISHFTSTKAAPDHHITSTMLDRWRQALFQHLFTYSASHKCFICVIQTPQTLIRLSITLFSNLPLSNVCVLLPISIFSFYWPVSDVAFSLPLIRPASQSRLFTVDVDIGVLQVPFKVAAS